MIGLLIRMVIVALGLWLAAKTVPGVGIASNGDLIAAALLLPGCASVDQDDGASAARAMMVGEEITRHG